MSLEVGGRWVVTRQEQYGGRRFVEEPATLEDGINAIRQLRRGLTGSTLLGFFKNEGGRLVPIEDIYPRRRPASYPQNGRAA